jgi:cytochrome b
MNNLQTNVRWSNSIIKFHILLIVGIIILYISGDDYVLIHEIIGFLILFLLIWRIFYSFITNKASEKINSWFMQIKHISTFVKTFHKHKENKYHNPLASLMIIGFFVMLFLMIITGELGLVGDEEEGLFSLFMSVNYKLGEWLLDIHEFGGDLLLIMIVLHIIGAIISSIISKQNLIKSIFIRNKQKMKNEK